MGRNATNYLHFFKIITVFICTLFISQEGHAQCPAEITPINTGTTAGFWGVSFATETTGYAVGDNGIIFKTTDGGNTWKQIESPVKKYLMAIQFVNSTTGYIVGDSGTVLKTTDGGVTWQALNFPNVYLTELSFVTPDIGYVSGENSFFIWKTRNGGLSWTADSIKFSGGSGEPNRAVSFCFTDTATGYMASDYSWLGRPSYPLSITTNGSVSWTSKASEVFGWNGVTCSDKNTVFACGTGIIRTTDGLTTYSTVCKVQGLNDISFSGNYGYAAGTAIVRTTDGGITWDSLSYSNESGNDFYSIYTLSDGNAVAVGDNGTILKITANCSTLATGIAAAMPASQFNIYPNPNSGSFTISTSGSNSTSNVQVYNAWGLEIKSLPLSGQQNTINLGTTASGIYYVNVSSGSGNTMQKVVVE